MEKTIKGEFDGLAERLTELLEQNGETPHQVSKVTGIEHATIYYLCTGKRVFSPILFGLSDYFGVNVEWLARGKGAKH